MFSSKLITLSNVLLYQMISCAKNHAQIKFYPNVSMDSCGFTAVGRKNIINDRYYDGINTTIGEFPWMVSVFSNFSDQTDVYCFGAIINKFWILTAAKCFDNKHAKKDNYSIFAGTVIHNEGKQYKIKNYYMHENYDPIKKRIYNIALVELQSEIKPEINSTFYSINGICLPIEKALNNLNESAIFSGWANTGSNGKEKILSLIKSKYMIESFNSTKCPNKQICILKDEHKTCYKENGSPLIQFVGNRAVIIGIHSNYNNDKCEPFPINFIRVSHFIHWISAKINKKSEMNTTENNDIMTTTENNETMTGPEQSVSNDEIKAAIIVGSIFIILLIVAIFVSIVVLIIIYRRKTKVTHSGSTLQSNTSETLFDESTVQTINSETGLVLSQKKFHSSTISSKPIIIKKK